MSSPVTIGDLKREGKLLEIGCMACNRHLYIDPASIALPDHQPVPTAAGRLVCSVCGANNRRTPEQARRAMASHMGSTRCKGAGGSEFQRVSAAKVRIKMVSGSRPTPTARYVPGAVVHEIAV